MPEVDGMSAVADVEVRAGDSDGGAADQDSSLDSGASDQGSAERVSDGQDGGDDLAGSGADDSGADAGAQDLSGKLPQQYKSDKFVKGLYYANQKLKQHFPGGVTEAVKIKQSFERYGGEEGLADFDTLKRGFETIDKDFAEGNEAVLDEMVAEGSDGFVKLMGPALDRFQKVNAEAYNHTLGKVFWYTLLQHGVVNDLSALETALEGKNFEQAVAALSKVGKFLETMNGLATKVPEKKIDPEREAFQKEKSEWEQGKQKEFGDGVRKDIGNYSKQGIETRLAREFTARNMNLAKIKTSDPESYSILLENCYNAVNRAAQKDGGAIQRYTQAIQGGNREKAVEIGRRAVDGVLSDAVSRTYRAFYRLGGGKPTPVATNGNGSGKDVPRGTVATGVVMLSKPPSPELLDKSRMIREFGQDKTNSMIWKGQFYIKGKKALHQTP
jgi:hypothetical protein